MIRVCVIFGGLSSEHEVSLRSAKFVLDSLDRTKYEVVLLGITKQGRWLRFTGPEEMIPTGEWQSSGFVEPAVISPDVKDSGILLLQGEAPASVKLRRRLAGFKDEIEQADTAQSTPRVLTVDVVFPVLHGKNGEDGTIQGLLELAGIPYVGCDVISSANCMDKEVAHILLQSAGVRKTKLKAITQASFARIDFEEYAKELEDELEYPMFVKPANAGSSVGVSKVKSKEDLLDAIQKAFAHDKKIVIEKAMVGREIECAVMGNEEPIASYALGEILPSRDFYDYDGKYNDDSAGLEAPAKLDYDIANTVREMAVKAYKAMGCKGLARVDFFVEEDGSPILNEINTLPGFTSISMFPHLFELEGSGGSILVNKLINYAME